MSTWPVCPLVYEINTWVWLFELGRKIGRPVDLCSVPAAEWDAVAALGFHAVWFMGVWERSPAGIAVANRDEGLGTEFRRVLPDYGLEDNVGSPYCVRRYVADQHLGGPAGLACARRELVARGMRLLLDFVPNHVAPDHPWIAEQPGYFIRGTEDDMVRDPASFIQIDGAVYACGRDPYFPAWRDVVQLNAFDAGLRQAVRATLLDLAGQCDGVRCDMAMLLLNAIFERTWGVRAGSRPSTDYWKAMIPSVKQMHPDFLFIAEAYWDLESELMEQGFDFCYDKRLYDRLEHDNARNVAMHLGADPSYQHRLVRFVENHDEPRAATAFGPAKARAAAVAASTLPGTRLFHEGQLDGRRVRLPVFLRRRPEEPLDGALPEFYARLIAASRSSTFSEGQWALCDHSGWPDNASHENLVAWRWAIDEEYGVVVVNLSDHPAQGMIRIDWTAVASASGVWLLHDVLSGVTYERAADQLAAAGLYVDLAPWAFHLFECRPRKQK